MKKLLFLVLLSIAAIGSMQGQNKYYDEEVDAVAQIKAATTLAQQSSRHVLCQVGGNWCPWCIRFADFATTDSVIAPIIAREYVYVHINYSKGHKNPEAMRMLGNPARFGFPVFVILDGDGNLLHIQESESLEQDKGYNRDRVRKFLLNWTPQAVSTLK